jgi:redox-sensitive bicupin YhaK (pirin superfamily)
VVFRDVLLLDPSAPNPLELFQIWLNLPAAANKMVAHFTMLWRETSPPSWSNDAEGAAAPIPPSLARLRRRVNATEPAA